MVAEFVQLLKSCTKCGRPLPPSSFAPDKDQKSGLRPECRECASTIKKRYYEKHKEKILEKNRVRSKTEPYKSWHRNYYNKRNELDRLKRATRPKPLFCECCGDHAKDKRHGIVFDHDHVTGLFRGWICNRCNRVLGMCKDNPVLLKLLARYLENMD